MGQAVASAFAAGAMQGGTTALQNAMKEREDRKNQSKRELDLYRSLTSSLPATPDNKRSLVEGSLLVMDGQNARDVFEQQKDTFQYSNKVATEPIYAPDTGEVLAYNFKNQVLYPQKPTSSPSANSASIEQKRKIDMARGAVTDITKRINDLEKRKKDFEFQQNAGGVSSGLYAPPFTDDDQRSLDSLKFRVLPDYEQRVSTLRDTGSLSIDRQAPQETDPFAEFLDTSQ